MHLVLWLFCMQGQYAPSYLCCPETYTWHPVSECVTKLDVNKYSRFAAPTVGMMYTLRLILLCVIVYTLGCSLTGILTVGNSARPGLKHL